MLHRYRILLSLFAVILGFGISVADSSAEPIGFYIGTYTRGESEGIYRSSFDPATGKMTEPKLVALATNPTFLAWDPAGENLYAVGEVYKDGGVIAYTADRETGRLTKIGETSSGGPGPCHLSVDPSGQCVIAANYGGGSVVSIPIREDGSLGEAGSIIQHEGSGPNEKRQRGAHAHSADVDSSGLRAVFCDLGCDRVFIYDLDPKAAKLAPAELPSFTVAPGAGPRHLAFAPDGKTLYVLNELNSTIDVMAYDAEKGTVERLQTIETLPNDFDGQNTTAEIAVHPSGKFLYASNRGHDSIACFKIDPTSGKLALIERESTGGEHPRHFTIDPTGKYLLAANRDTNNIVVLRINQETGALTPTGQEIELSMPVCILFDK